MFHDIGKIGVPDSILLKESKLTNEEYSQIKNHPSIGEHILLNATIFKDIIPIVKHHHEKLPIEIVKEELKNCSGTQFDPEIIKVFIDILENDYDKIKDIQNRY